MRFLIFLIGFFFIQANAFCQSIAELDSLASNYYQLGEFDKAIPFAEKEVELINKNGREKHPDYLFANNLLGILYKKTGNLLKAEPYYKLVAEFRKKEFGEKSEEYVLALNQLAILNEMMKRYDAAITIYKQAISIYLQINTNAETYAALIRNLALVYETVEDHKSAEPLLAELLEITAKQPGIESEEHATALNDLAVVKDILHQYDKAVELYIRSLDIYKKINANPKDYSVVISNLAALYDKIKKYKEAEPLYIQLTEIKKDQFGENDIKYANSLNALGLFYKHSRQYTKAENVYLRSIDIAQKAVGENNEDYLIILDNLGSLYHITRQYAKTEEIYIKSQKITSQLYGNKNNYYASCLHVLAVLYQDMNQYEKAEQLYLQALEIKELNYQNDSLSYASTANAIGTLYDYKSEYAKSEKWLLKALSIRKAVLGEDNLNYAFTLNNLADLYYDKGELKKSEEFYKKTMEIRKRISGENDLDYSYSIIKLGRVYEDLGLYSKADSMYIQSLNIREQISGNNSLEYSASLKSLAGLYKLTGQYVKSENLYLQANEMRKQLAGEDHVYASGIVDQGLLYQTIGNYSKAESFLKKGLEIFKQQLGDQSPNYATALYNLAGLYKSMGDYSKTESYYFQVLAIEENTSGKNHPSYFFTLDGLAGLYKEMGDYSKAEPIYLQVLEMRKKILGEEHPDYAHSLDVLANLYSDIGQNLRAEQLYIQSIDIREKILGEEHPDYAVTIQNLALLYLDMGRYEKAESLFKKSIEVNKKIFGENDRNYADALNSIGGLYDAMNDNKKAEAYYLQAFEIRKKLLGENHPEYANSLNNIGTFYSKQEDYIKAISYLLQAKNTYLKLFGENNPQYVNSISSLAILYEITGDHQKAQELLLAISKSTLDNVASTFAILSEKEKGNYINTKAGNFNVLNSFLFYNNPSSSMAANNYNMQLALKSVALADTRKLLEAIRNSKDSSIKKLYFEWQSAKKYLATQYSLPISQRDHGLDSIVANVERYEKELNRSSSAFRTQQTTNYVTVKDLRNGLAKDEVAIEFVRFNLFNKKVTDSIMYAAYILDKNDSVPQFVPLCEEKQLGKYFSPTGGAATIKSIYRSEVVDEDGKPSISGDSLYALIWKPLLPYLKGVKKINYSPAGLLYKVAFHALPAGDSLLLMDLYELSQYTSTRQLTITEEKKNSNTSISFFGDCQFTMDSTTIVNKIPANEKANTLITANLSRGENSGGWKALSGTATEIKGIQTLFDQNKISTASFSQSNATEEQFKLLSGNSSSIIHLATHGFFLPDPEKKRQEGFAADERNAFTLADDPLLRSGIVLSGANRVWSGQAPIAGREDGIVTAYEIAQMDLSKTDLVVLSACETALGDIKGSEGVFGLQRAFKLAGVKNMLLSLWKVPDAETAELMKDFYTYYLQGKTAREAFSSAQKDMRKKYKPYFWAAFVLIE